jgi:hypothetical protein
MISASANPMTPLAIDPPVATAEDAMAEDH